MVTTLRAEAFDTLPSGSSVGFLSACSGHEGSDRVWGMDLDAFSRLRSEWLGEAGECYTHDLPLIASRALATMRVESLDEGLFIPAVPNNVGTKRQWYLVDALTALSHP